MKRLFYLLVAAAIAFSATSCSGSMKRDVKRLSHKTTQCFSMIDVTDPNVVPSDEFNECYSELEKLMEEYNDKYSSKEDQVKFGRMYLEELQNSDLPQEMKDLYNYLYNLGESGVDINAIDQDFEDDLDITIEDETV